MEAGMDSALGRPGIGTHSAKRQCSGLSTGIWKLGASGHRRSFEIEETTCSGKYTDRVRASELKLLTLRAAC